MIIKIITNEKANRRGKKRQKGKGAEDERNYVKIKTNKKNNGEAK